MSSFTTPLDVRYLPKQNKWLILRELIYHVGDEDSGDVVIVPKFYVTDFASVPWPAVMLIPKSGRYNSAAVVHDYLYQMMKRPKIECDKIFLEAMLVLGVPTWKRLIMYRAVRMNFIKAMKWGKK